MLVSDNGASGEGGPNGSVNENKFFNGDPGHHRGQPAVLEELGSPATYNHYPTGWACAFNTPFKLWKRYSNWEGGTAEVPESVAPNIRNRSYTIAVEVTLDTEDAAGVLFAHGARFGGHALYVKDRRLKYC